MTKALIALAIIASVTGTQIHVVPADVVRQIEGIVKYAASAAASLPGLHERMIACSNNYASTACSGPTKGSQ